MHLYLKIVLIFASTLLVSGQRECTVAIKDGTVRGRTQTIWNPPKEICSYTAIPYASPPIGHLRFRAPTPPAPFGELDATTNPNPCPQAGTSEGYVVSEDCLYLNVYVPKEAPEGLPVMVFFHGGSFTGGSAELYTPDKLLGTGDVILVVVHYRLGLLGFLNTEDYNSPGNYGLKDQSYSIHWVKENINYFGGDPNKLTIFGESAGGSSVMYQIISPLNRGMINGAISQSGTALVSWAFDDTPLASARTIASVLLCPTITNELMVACLRTIPWQKIVEAQTLVNLLRSANYQLPTAGVVPSVEPNLPGAFISKHPLEIMKSGDIENIPLIIGANKHDGSFVLGGIYQGNIGPWGRQNNPEYMRNQLIPDMLKLLRIQDDEGNRAAAASIEMTYFGGANRSSWEESMPGLVDFVTVFAYKASVMSSADLLTKWGSKVYVYSMEHSSNVTMWDVFFPDPNSRPPVEGGITHADDLLYLFDYGQGELEESDKAFEKTMLDYWLNFGRDGKPSADWPEYDLNSEYYMKLDVEPEVRERYRDSWRPNTVD